MRDGFSPGRGSGSSGVVVGEPVAERSAVGDDGELDPAVLRALGAAVRELRARRGLSQESLGLRGGLHRNYVGAIERGEQNVTFRVLLKLVSGLHVPLSELVVMYERNRMRQLGILPPPPPGLTSGGGAAAGLPGVVDAGGPQAGSADPAPGGSPTRRAPQRSAEPRVPGPVPRAVLTRRSARVVRGMRL